MDTVELVVELGLEMEENNCQLGVLVVGDRNVVWSDQSHADLLEAVLLEVVGVTPASVEEELHNGQAKAQLAEPTGLQTKSGMTFDVVGSPGLGYLIALVGMVLAQAWCRLREAEVIAD